MPAITTTSRENPEFPRILETADLRETAEFPFDLAPNGREPAAIARLMGAQSLRKLRFTGRLIPIDPAGWLLEGDLGATVIQTCVVTLEPVTTRIDQPVRRRFLPLRAPRAAEVLIAPDEDDEIEALGSRIDLGLVALEALALALPAYPRKDGAVLPPGMASGSGAGTGDDTPPDETTRPFAGLAALRDALDNKS
jgi:uncharacterized metal-binding protein YceD (DUF177 family)